MRARETQRAVWLHRDEKLVTLAEVQLLADFGRKDQPPAVPELNAKSFGVGHLTNIPHVQMIPTSRASWEYGWSAFPSCLLAISGAF
jgi:hypothetical protein